MASLNTAIYRLYSIDDSILQYRQYLGINPDITYIYHKQLYKDDLYIEIPEIPEIIIISNIKIHNNTANFEIIADKNIIKCGDSILIKKYKKVFIRIYDITSHKNFKISFDVTLAKLSLRSCL